MASTSARVRTGRATTGPTPGLMSRSTPTALSGSTMSEKKMAASTPYRRTGCRVISTTMSGSMQASSIAVPSRRARYSGSERPACRMYQTGVCWAPPHARRGGTGCRRGWSRWESSQVRRRVDTSGGGPDLLWPMVARQESHPATGADGPAEFRAAVGACRCGPARGVLRGDAGPAAHRAVVDRAVRGRHGRRGRPRHRPHHPAARPRRQRRVGGHLPLRRLRPRGDRPRARHRPDARRRRLDLADRGARRPRRGVPRRVRHGHQRRHRELRRDGRRGRHRPARGPRVVDPGSPTSTASRRHDAARRGLGRAAVHRRRAAPGARGRHRHPEPARSARLGTEPMPAPNRPPPSPPGTAAEPTPDETPRHPRPPRPLLDLRDGLPPVVDTEAALLEACAQLAAGHRPGRHRRRAGLGLPLLLARLPHPAAPRGRRHLAGRPDRVRVAGSPPGGARRAPSGSCTPPPRTCPACARSGSPRPRSSTPSSPAGCSATRASGWPPWSRRCWASGCARSTRPPTGRRGRCPSRGSSTPPSTSRCSSSCATRWPPSWSSPARPTGPARSSTTCSPSSSRARGGVAPYLRGAPAPRPPRARRRPRAVGGARRDRRPARRHPRPDRPRRRDRGRRPGDADRSRGAARHPGLPRPRRRAVRHPLGDRPARGARDGRGRPAHPRPPRRGPAAAARLGGPRPGRGAPLQGRPRGDGGRRRGPRAAGREPAHPRLPAPRDVDAARDPRARRPADAVRAQLPGYGARTWQVELVTGAGPHPGDPGCGRGGRDAEATDAGSDSGAEPEPYSGSPRPTPGRAPGATPRRPPRSAPRGRRGSAR